MLSACAGARTARRRPGGRADGRPAERRGGLASFTLDGVHPHDVAELAGRAGVCIRAGHHCAQPLMRCMGVSATARASVSVYNERSDIDALARCSAERARGVRARRAAALSCARQTWTTSTATTSSSTTSARGTSASSSRTTCRRSSTTRCAATSSGCRSASATSASMTCASRGTAARSPRLQHRSPPRSSKGWTSARSKGSAQTGCWTCSGSRSPRHAASARC